MSLYSAPRIMVEWPFQDEFKRQHSGKDVQVWLHRAFLNDRGIYLLEEILVWVQLRQDPWYSGGLLSHRRKHTHITGQWLDETRPLTYLLSHRAHLGRGWGCTCTFASDVRVVHLFIKRHNLSTFESILNMRGKNHFLTCTSICTHMKI